MKCYIRQQALVLLAVLICSSIIVAVPVHAVSPNVGVLISGPTDIALNSTAQYAVTITGGPAEVESGWWKYDAHLEMDNRSGSPGVDPSTGNSTHNTFRFNVTAPSVEQIITLVVTGHSGVEGESKSEVRRLQIRIVKPVVLSAVVHNSGDVAVVGVPVVFYADQQEIARVKVNLNPGETKNVIANWTSFVSDQYTITVKIDPDGRFMDVHLADNVLSTDIHVGQRSNLYNWLYGTTLVILAMFAVLMILSSKQRKKPTPKWR